MNQRRRSLHGLRSAGVFAATLAFAVAAGCGGDVTDDAASSSTGAGGAGGANASGGPSSSTSSSSASSSVAVTASTASTGSGGGRDCAALIDAMTTRLRGDHATVVRLDFTSKALLGYHVFDANGVVDETGARALAVHDTTVGAGAQQIAGPSSPGDFDFVFWEAPGDFGASAVVWERGATVFGGTTVWGGAGEITYPTDWSPAADLGPQCGTHGAPAIRVTGFDLGSGMPLADDLRDAALQVAWNTVIVAAYMQVAYPQTAVVLAYPRTVGPTDPGTEELIVVMNSIFLE